jgi:hypothetical protein
LSSEVSFPFIPLNRKLLVLPSSLEIMSNIARSTTLVIVNPAAARVARIWQDLRGELIARGVRFDEHLTTAPGDAETRARHALTAETYDTIIATGGDGTLSETAAGFFARLTQIAAARPVRPDATLAILPAGTGDDFARGLLGTRTSAKDWLERFIRYHNADAAHRNVRRVDVLDGAATLLNSQTSSDSQTSRPPLHLHQRRDARHRRGCRNARREARSDSSATWRRSAFRPCRARRARTLARSSGEDHG